MIVEAQSSFSACLAVGIALDDATTTGLLLWAVASSVIIFLLWTKTQALKKLTNHQDQKEELFHAELLDARIGPNSRNMLSLLRIVADGTSDTIYVKDLKGRYLFMNPAGAHSINLEVEDILGRTAEDLFDRETAELVAKSDIKALESNGEITYEGTLRSIQLKQIFMTTKGIYRDESGEPIGLFGISRDITQQRHSEHESKDLREQLLHAQKMEAVGTLAGGIAHDFNNLLTGLLGEVQLMMYSAEQLPEEAKRGLRNIQEVAVRASELTRQLLEISRRRPPEFKQSDLNRVVQRATRLLRRAIPSSIDVHVELDPTLPVLRADGGQLEHAILNLGINARDAMQDGGEMKISVRKVQFSAESIPPHPEARAGEFACISLQDSGEGIPTENLTRIFEPFYSTKEEGKGTGLGLSMVYACIQAHEGWIEVESTPNKGTQFKLYLPLITDDSIELEASEPITSEMTLPQGSETLLVVDDTDTVLFMARDILELCGYTVLTAWNGQEAVEVFEQHHSEIDGVVTDLVMPKSGGRSLLADLRKRGWKGPVLLASGHGIYARSEEAQQEGFADLVQKPFEPKKLAQSVRQILDNATS